MCQNHRGGLLKRRLLGLRLRVPDSVDLGQGPNVHVLNKFPGEAHFPGDHILSITVLEKWYFRKLVQHYVILCPYIISDFLLEEHLGD